MAGTDWIEDVERWLEPFVARLGHKARRRMCPLYRRPNMRSMMLRRRCAARLIG
jgi:hypothetical protein